MIEKLSSIAVPLPWTLAGLVTAFTCGLLIGLTLFRKHNEKPSGGK